MSRIAVDISIASLVFFVLVFFLETLGFGKEFSQETLITSVFRTLMFAMVYAAIRVGIVIFKDAKNETVQKD